MVSKNVVNIAEGKLEISTEKKSVVDVKTACASLFELEKIEEIVFAANVIRELNHSRNEDSVKDYLNDRIIKHCKDNNLTELTINGITVSIVKQKKMYVTSEKIKKIEQSKSTLVKNIKSTLITIMGGRKRIYKEDEDQLISFFAGAKIKFKNVIQLKFK